MRRRAELVEGTRQQITAAAARLHTTIGPANTTIAAIADEAGVTRLTVYRHFADLDALFEACQAHWRAENPAPDARLWADVEALEPRVRRALGELYEWFEEHATEFFPVYRDFTTMPMSAQEAMREDNRRLGDLLVGGHVPDGERGRPARAVARHLVDYPTWRSLVIDRDLTHDQAVDLGVRMICDVTARPLCSSPR